MKPNFEKMAKANDKTIFIQGYKKAQKEFMEKVDTLINKHRVDKFEGFIDLDELKELRNSINEVKG